MRRIIISFGIVCAIGVSFHLGAMWATNEVYRSIDAIHEDVQVLSFTPHKTRDYRIMDKYK